MLTDSAKVEGVDDHLEVLDLAEVISILARQNAKKRLSTGERRLLGNARQILASEVMIVKSSDLETAEEWIDAALRQAS